MNKRWSEIEPNAGHKAIFQFYQRGVLKFLISQNVDNLHLKSGIPMNIIAELHGNSSLMRCLQCDTQFSKEGLWDESVWGKGYRTDPIRKGQPKCPKCGGRLISSVVNFKDPMPEKEMGLSYYHSKNADIFLVVGSSLSVVPAAHMPLEAKQNGAKLIIINHMETGMDNLADLRFHENAGEVLTNIIKLIEPTSQ
jgi:NAD-dependent deacetylase